MSIPKPPPYPADARRRKPGTVGRSRQIDAPTSHHHVYELRALATRIHARADHTLVAFSRPERPPASDARLPACLPSDLGATLREVAGSSVVWSSRAGEHGALRVPELRSFAAGWRAAAGELRLGPDAAGYVVIDEVDGGSRGLVAMDERGRCRCVWVPSGGDPVVVARTIDGYLERCLAHAARHEWPRAAEPRGIDRPTPEEAASHALVHVRCRDARTVSVEEVCARRLASLGCHADMARTLRVAPADLATTLRAMGAGARPRGLGALLRDSRRGPQSIAELRRWAYLDADATPWVDVALEIEPNFAPVPRELPRLAWLALRAADGEVTPTEATWRQLMDDPEREPPADDARFLVAASAQSLTFTLPAARCPVGCVVGARWVAVVPTAPTLAGPP
jgi:hypothetical protein